MSEAPLYKSVRKQILERLARGGLLGGGNKEAQRGRRTGDVASLSRMMRLRSLALGLVYLGATVSCSDSYLASVTVSGSDTKTQNFKFAVPGAK